MKAVVIEPEKDRLGSLFSESSKLMVNVMDRPLIYHIKDYLSGWGISIAGVAGVREEGGFFEEFGKTLSTKDIIGFLRNASEEILLISRPAITDISLDSVISAKRNSGEITAVFCGGKSTGMYIIGEKFNRDNPVIRNTELEGYFNPLESSEEYIGCHRDILCGRLSVSTGSCSETSGVIMGENTLLKIGSQINPPVYIGRGTVVESGAKIDAYSVIGADCVISSGACTGGSVINKGCFIGADAVLKKALLAPLVRVKKKAVVNELSLIGEAAVIGEGVTVDGGIEIGKGKFASGRTKITEKIPVFRFSDNVVSGRVGEDFSVEDASRLGACFSRLNPNLRIAVATDESSSALMIKYAFISGIMSVGGEAADLGAVPVYILKFSPTVLKAAAGVYISGGGEVKLSFFSRDFLPLRNKDMKRLERMYPSGNFARCGSSGIKETVAASNISEIYYEKTASLLVKEKTKGYVYCEFSKCEEEYAKYLSEKTGIVIMNKRKKGYISASLSEGKIGICDEKGRVLSHGEIACLTKRATYEFKGVVPEDDLVFLFFRICGILLSE